MPRKQIVPPLQVEWTGVFENYARKWVNRNFWRVTYTLGTKEDALQECAMIWVRCRNHYMWSVDNPAWFMSLYKLALVNDWHTMAKWDGLRRNTIPPESIDRVASPCGTLAVAFHEASAELQIVLGMIANAPAELLEIFFSDNDPRIINRRLCRFSGIRYGVADICGELRALLTN